jgi:hypothetical protein
MSMPTALSGESKKITRSRKQKKTLPANEVIAEVTLQLKEVEETEELNAVGMIATGRTLANDIVR